MIFNQQGVATGGGGSMHLLTFDNSVENTSVIYSDGNDVADASSDSVNIQGGELVVIICWDNFQFVVTGATTDIAPAQYYEGVFAFVMPDEDVTLSVA